MADNMEVLALSGPLGAGKTTTLNELIQHVPIDESYAVIVNDVGADNVDAQRITDHPANRSERVIPLTAGCIGCSDVTQFREALERVASADIDMLFIEPTGIAPGTEIVDVVRGEGHDLAVMTLVNTRTVERDVKWQVLPSQLAVANVVGLTHAPEDVPLDQTMALALEQMPPLGSDVAIRVVRPEEIDAELLAELRGHGQEYSVGSRVMELATDHHHHHHDHDHDHEHDGHGVTALSLQLRDGVTSEDLARVLHALALDGHAPLLRAKGVIGAERLDLVGEEINIVNHHPVDTSRINVIFAGNTVPEGADALLNMVDDNIALDLGDDKKAIVKSVSHLPVAEREEIINERVTQYPHPINTVHGELIPDCEADDGYEIAFWGVEGDDEHVSNESRLAAMSAYIRFRLEGLSILNNSPEDIVNVDEKRAYWMRRYGATLGYNGYYLNDFIDPADLAQVREANPAQMLRDGLMELDELTFAEDRAEEKPEFVAMVLKRALEYGHIDAADVESLIDRMLDLSVGNQEFVDRWQKARASLL